MSQLLERQIVETARALISDKIHWVRDVYSEDDVGDPCHWSSKSAYRFCAQAALWRAAYDVTLNVPTARSLGEKIIKSLPLVADDSLQGINHAHGHKAVLALFDEYLDKMKAA